MTEPRVQRGHHLLLTFTREPLAPRHGITRAYSAAAAAASLALSGYRTLRQNSCLNCFAMKPSRPPPRLRLCNPGKQGTASEKHSRLQIRPKALWKD
ncbi:hypothetical protein E2C01_086986 [Portunus trituberculatus]|uniref:Uncharacterized protein n=1 Tax=Portunus trituberculatus TaxID=210409 RepID=A0A5B7JC44_PORTR|nr:hypothetical protein [Portunus trituberculatus]